MILRMFVLQVLYRLIQTRREQEVPLREVRVLNLLQDVTVEVGRSHSLFDLGG